MRTEHRYRRREAHTVGVLSVDAEEKPTVNFDGGLDKGLYLTFATSPYRRHPGPIGKTVWTAGV